MMWINVLFILTIIFLICFLYAFLEKYWLQVKKYQININKTNYIGKKIIFLSDFHHSPIVKINYIKKVVNTVNNLKPDIIILGGDYVSNHKKYIQPLFNELKLLRANLGVYGVIGNHDINVSKKQILQAMKEANINSLDNLFYRIYNNKESIVLCGVKDFLYDKPSIEEMLKNVDYDDFVILVCHNPDYLEEIKDKKIDLMLSGHTHGGQVTMFGLYAPYIPSNFKQKYRTGLKINNNIKLIISNGVGCVGLPIRFFSRPQIVEIEFYHNKI